MTADPDLSIIIVNWNSAEFVDRCIRSIRRETAGLAYEIIVADNASYDGCDKLLQGHGSGVVYLQSGRNLGFARANNLAFEVSRGTSLLFLNPDTEIVGPSIIRLHRALHELPGAGAVGGRLLNSDGSLQTSCIQSFPTIVNQVCDMELFRRVSPRLRLWGMAPLFRNVAHPEPVEVISGACLMVKRDIFQQVGRFTEEYFMYGEDADLCYKLKVANRINYYVPDVTVVHFGGGSSRRVVGSFAAMMMRESIWQFLRRTEGNISGACYRGSMLMASCFRLGLLGIAAPLQAFRGRRGMWRSSFRKWWAILLWSLRRTKPLRESDKGSDRTLDRCQFTGVTK
jgi:hypothetical protein